MNTTFHLELGNRTKAGIPVRIRITRDRRSKRIKTSIVLKREGDWNPEREEVRASEIRHKAWNEQLQKELDEARQVYREHKEDSIAEVVDKIKNKDVSGSFLSFAKSKVDESKSNQTIGTYRHFLSAVNMLESFLESKKRSDISFNEINLSFLKEYESYLGNVSNGREKGRKLDKSTIATYLKRLRKLVNEAEQEGYIASSPFGKGGGKFSIREKRGGTKEKLDVDELGRIINVDLPAGSAEWNARNAFLFSFYCGGIRVGDVMQLRWRNVNDGRIVYVMDKNGKYKNLKMPQDALDILALYKSENAKETDYIFPFLNSNADYAKESARGRNTMPEESRSDLFNKISSRNVIINRNLKKVAEKAGITKNVTFHTSRHSFANVAKNDGIESSKIQGVLGHSSLSTTENYMGHFGQDETDRVLEKVAESVNEPKPVESPKEALISQLKALDGETLAEVLKSLKNG